MKYVVTRAKCKCVARKYRRFGYLTLHLPEKIGFGDTVAEFIHHFLKIVPCAACQRRRRFLNIVFPYVSRESLEYRAWNDYLASDFTSLPCVWDEETGKIDFVIATSPTTPS